jgi:hypothetical protein
LDKQKAKYQKVSQFLIVIPGCYTFFIFLGNYYAKLIGSLTYLFDEQLKDFKASFSFKIGPTDKAKLSFLLSAFVTLFSSSYGLMIFKFSTSLTLPSPGPG